MPSAGLEALPSLNVEAVVGLAVDPVRMCKLAQGLHGRPKMIYATQRVDIARGMR